MSQHFQTDNCFHRFVYCRCIMFTVLSSVYSNIIAHTWGYVFKDNPIPMY